MLQYKTFVWPNDPETYRENCVRDPQYITVDGVPTYIGMSKMKRVISGNGVFFGEQAYEKYLELVGVFGDSEPGDLVHPDFGTRLCYFTGLEMTQEARENCVSYKFEFTGSRPDGEVPK